MEQLKLSYIAYRNVNWQNHYGGLNSGSQKLRLLSRARPVTDQQSLRTARSSPNPRAQVDSAGPRPALSAGPTPPRPPGRSPVPAARASGERGRPRPLWRETIIRARRGGGYGSSSVSSVRGTCRAGGRPAEKTNRCFFFLLLLLLPHRNTHKHPARGPSYRGGIAAGPGTNPPVGGGVPPCGLVVSGESVPTEGGGGRAGGRSPVCVSLSFRLSLSEQNADRKCSCRNDSLRRRQTLTTTPSSPLHFRHRRRRRCCCHFGLRPRALRPCPGSRCSVLRSTADQARDGSEAAALVCVLLLSASVDVAFIVDPAERRFLCGASGPVLPGLYFTGGPQERGTSSMVVVCLRGAQDRIGPQAAVAEGGGRVNYPSSSSFGLGSRTWGGHVEDTRCSTGDGVFI
ncbi:uncharacterized protein ACIGJ3_011364 [Trichechus inunguis]